MGLLKVESRLPNTPWLSQSEVPLLELSTADFKDIRGPHLFGPGPRGGGCLTWTLKPLFLRENMCIRAFPLSDTRNVGPEQTAALLLPLFLMWLLLCIFSGD